MAACCVSKVRWVTPRSRSDLPGFVNVLWPCSDWCDAQSVPNANQTQLDEDTLSWKDVLFGFQGSAMYTVLEGRERKRSGYTGHYIQNVREKFKHA